MIGPCAGGTGGRFPAQRGTEGMGWKCIALMASASKKKKKVLGGSH